MKRKILFTLLLITLILPACGPKYSGKNPPNAKDGVLDLSNWDFDQDGPLKLNGEWGFFWKKLIAPQEFAANPDKYMAQKDHIQVPGSWNSYKDVESKDVGGEGYATYVLKIKGLKTTFQEDLAIQLIEASTAYSLYFIPSFSNTAEKESIVSRLDYSAKYQPVLKIGTVSSGRSKAIPQLLPESKRLSLVKEENYILVQVSNYRHRAGGILEPISFGPENILGKMRDKDRFLSATIIGLLFIMALYHFGLFSQRREDKASLLFGLFCLLVSFRMCTTDRFIHELFPAPDAFIFELLYKIEYLTFYFAPPLFYSFFRRVFKNEFSRFFERLIWAVSILFIVEVIIFPVRTYSDYNFIYLVVTLMACSIAVYGITRAVLHRKEGSLIALTGFIIVFLTIINDMLHSQSIIHTAYITQFGLVAFIFAQSYMLSKLFANTFRRAERLNLELGESNTKLESAYNEIVEKERARTLFFHNTSHELRTPLNGILGFADLIFRGAFGQAPNKIKEQVGKIHRLADSLKMQVNTILDLAKSRKGQLKLIVNRLNLEEIKNQCQLLSEGLKMKFPGSGFTVEIKKPDSDKFPFFGDPEKIITVLRNLLGNAFKFSRIGQKNQIKLIIELIPDRSPKDSVNNEQAGNLLQIVVSDTGIGIPRQQINHIFEEFKQVESDANRAYEGTGLGLSLVKKLVTLMQGKIEVESKKNQGTTFKISIPSQPEDMACAQSDQTLEDQEERLVLSQVAAAANDETGPPAEDERIKKSLPSDILSEVGLKLNPSQFKILVVDDNQVNVEVLAGLLRSQEFQVEESYGGRDALEKIWDNRPDLVLLDLMMPDISGEDVLKQVRSDEKLQDLPIIIITARASQEDRILGLKMGADDYIAKPIIPDDLLLRVNSILTRLHLTRKAMITEQAIQAKKEAEIAENITRMAKQEVEEAHLKLQEMDKVKSDFFQNITHELRTPLTLILGPLETISNPKPEDNLNHLSGQGKLALRNARRLLRLVNQLLDLAKLSEGKMGLSVRPVDLVEMLQYIFDSFLSLAGQTQIQFDFLNDPKKINAFLDPEKMEKVIYNLLSNAFKFTPQGGKISLQLSILDGHKPEESLQNDILLISNDPSFREIITNDIILLGNVAEVENQNELEDTWSSNSYKVVLIDTETIQPSSEIETLFEKRLSQSYCLLFTLAEKSEEMLRLLEPFTETENNIQILPRQWNSDNHLPLIKEALSQHRLNTKIKRDIQIVVKDTGQGIPSKDLPYIFDRFRQVDGSSTREFEGTGIGLSLVKEYVEMHSGKVRVESEPGKGTSFVISLAMGKDHFNPDEITEVAMGSKDPYFTGELPDRRLNDDPSLAAVEERLQEDKWGTPRRLEDRRSFYSSHLEKMGLETNLPPLETEVSSAQLPADAARVLVVEDNYDMRQYIRGILGGHYLVQEAVNGEEGLKKALEIKPDIILSDVMMPKMDGNQLLKALKANEQTRHIPMILLTAKASEDLRLEGLEAGADDYLSKPFNSNELFARIKNMLQLKSREKSLIENVLKRYMPPDLVDQMIESQKNLDGKPQALTATILFSDLVDFTSTTSKLRATRMAGILNDYLAEMIRVIFEAGGTIDKFIGDAIMVIFGAPLEMKSAKQVEKACLCAHSMQKAMVKLNQKWQENKISEIKMRIGIHHGPVVAGNFGSSQRTDYTAIGPAVNLASRIEGVCSPGEVFISGEVSDYLPEEMFEEAGEFTLKGVQGKSNLYKLGRF